MPSIKDVAMKAGVSVRTVGRALYGGGPVKDEVRQRVELAVKQAGYAPNLAARSLKTGRGYLVAALVASGDELHMARLDAFQIEIEAAGFGLHVIFISGGKEPLGLVDSLVRLGVAGLACFHVSATRLRKEFEGRGLRLPAVAFDHQDPGADAVLLDRPRGIEEAVHDLAAKGRRRIAYLGPADPSRLDGYARAVRDLGLPYLVHHPDLKDGEISMGEQGMQELLDKAMQPDGVQAFSDMMAAGALRCCHRRGLRVPQDIALVGFDNRRLALCLWPQLTTVAQPNEEIGRRMACLLLARLRGAAPDAPVIESVTPMLVRREST